MEIQAAFPAVIDSTMRSAFLSCPHKFFLEFVFGLRSSAPSIHLHAGAVYARGLEVLRKEYYGKKTPLADCITEAYQAMVIEWGDMPGWEDHPKSFVNVVKAMIAYTEHYPLDSDPLKPHMTAKGPAVEFTFAIPIPNTAHPDTGEPILYAGRFDMLGEYQNALYVVDDKTTGSLGARWARQWRLRGQFTGYCWAAREFGFPIAGAIIRGCAFKKSGIDFADAITYRPNWLINQWLETLRHDLNRMAQTYKEMTFTKNFGDACAAYGDCDYVDLCDKENWEKWLEPGFVISHWNPLHKDPTAEP